MSTTTSIKNPRPQKTKTLRGRVDEPLKQRVNTFIAHPKVDCSESDFVRKSAIEYLEFHEKEILAAK